MSLNEIVKTMQDAVNRQAEQAKPGGYDTTATVRRIEDGVAWVHIPGGVDETPVKLTIDAKAGDNVQVRVSGGNAFLVGNASAPPTDDATAIIARMLANNASTQARGAKTTAEIAQMTADIANGNAEDARDASARAAAAINVLNFDLETAINGGYMLDIETEIQDSGINASAQLFYEAVGGVYGSYTFTYDGASWELGGNTVDLQDYGITMSDDVSLQPGDDFTITLLAVAGVNQTIEDNYDELVGMIDSASDEAADNLADAVDEINDTINEARNSIDDSIENLNTKTSRIGYSSETGLILYGEDATDQEKFKLQLSANAINFINGALGNGADIKAYITGNTLFISTANVTSQLQFGNFAFIPRNSDNGLSLKYMGE